MNDQNGAAPTRPASLSKRRKTSMGAFPGKSSTDRYRLNGTPQSADHYYLTKYPDVTSSIATGKFTSALHHYLLFGKAEGRFWDQAAEHAAAAALCNHTFDAAINLVRHLRLIAGSALFDAAWYREAYNVSPCADDVLLELFYYGHVHGGQNPNSYFDTAWYLQTNPDVAASSSPALVHYLEYGEAEGRRPAQIFDPAWYRATFMQSRPGVALAHFLKSRLNGRVSPLALFDTEYYLRTYPDIATAGVDPFQHYLHFGYLEDRNPSAIFHTRYYVMTHLKHSWAVNPLVHYLTDGCRIGLDTAPVAGSISHTRERRRFMAPAPEFEALPIDPVPPVTDVKLLAYYLPQFHCFPENDEWWGNGFTEWTNIGRGTPRFAGHYQPRIPRDLGFYNLTDPAVMRRQIELATSSGVYGFCMYYYNFSGKRLMQQPAEMFLEDATLDFPFCLMWANENWTRRWDGADHEVLIGQDYAPADDEALVADFARHMADPRYIRIGGRPLLMIYRAGVIPDTPIVIRRWRALFNQRYELDPLLIMAQVFGDTDPGPFGFDGAIEFPPHKFVQAAETINKSLHFLDYDFTGQVYDYQDVARLSLAEPAPRFPLIKTIMPSWDNEARRQGDGIVIQGSTPAAYQAWLTDLLAYARANAFYGEKIVCVNAWNEWAEGAYLEPDLHYGSAYLNATAKALALPAQPPCCKVLLVGHDAFPAGAQLLLLHLGLLYRNRFGIQVGFLLLGDGALRPRFEAVGSVEIASSSGALATAAAALHGRGFRFAIVNTAAAARAVPVLVEAGLHAIQLVHEGPKIIAERHLVADMASAAARADRVVFSSRTLAAQFYDLFGQELATRSIIRPQGLYRPHVARPAARHAIRKALGVPQTAIMLLNAGYADLRKGFDLFLQMWRHAQTIAPPVHLVWVGDMDPLLQSWLGPEIAVAAATGTFHHVPFTEGLSDYYEACDVFVLTSREDPFPSVVLEAIAAAKPVVVFEGSVGLPELIKPPLGLLVPLADPLAMLQAALTLAREPVSNAAKKARRGLIAKQFGFAEYGWHLLEVVGVAPPRVSVVVPGYNHAPYLAERMRTIFTQTAPVFEVVALDDASTDDSVATLKAIGQASGRDFRVHANKKNSGSPFVQWRKGLERTAGELVWIAEADDASEAGFLSKLITAFQDPAVVFAFCDSKSVDASTETVWSSYKEYYATVEPGLLCQDLVTPGIEFIARYLSIKNLILNVSSVLWRKTALVAALQAVDKEIPGFMLAGDWLVYAHACLLPGARVAYFAEPLNHHRRHDGGQTRRTQAARHVAEVQRMHEQLGRCIKLPRRVLRSQACYVAELQKQLGI